MLSYTQFATLPPYAPYLFRFYEPKATCLKAEYHTSRLSKCVVLKCEHDMQSLKCHTPKHRACEVPTCLVLNMCVTCCYCFWASLAAVPRPVQTGKPPTAYCWVFPTSNLSRITARCVPMRDSAPALKRSSGPKVKASLAP